MIIAINAISAKSGGIKTYTGNLIKSLRKYKKHIFHIWLPYNSDFMESENVILHKTRITQYNYFLRFLYEQIILIKKIKKVNANVIYSTGNFGLLFTSTKQILFLRNILFFDVNYLKYIYPNNSIQKNIRFHLKRFNIYISSLMSDIIIVGSNYMKKSFANFYPQLGNKCVLLYEGGVIDDFSFSKKSIGERDEIKLLYVSKYYAHKNPGVIADAVKMLMEQNIKVQARITMDLNTKYARSMATWKNDFQKLYNQDIQKNIILGEVSYKDVQLLYKKADIFIFPSISESYGHPMIEAMAAGLPIIAADTPINREICGDAAIYFSPFDGKELAEKIVMLHNNEDQKFRMIEIGRNRIKLFKWEDHVSRLIKIFEELYE